MRYVYTEDVIGTTSALGGCRSCGGGLQGFGQSGPYSDAVKRLQTGLRALAVALDNNDYHPGLDDGLYGRNTHAAILRLARDYLEPRGITSSTCRSTCNTLWLRAKGACADCLAQMLRGINDAFVGMTYGETDVPPEDAATTITPEMQGFGGYGATDAGAQRLSEADITEITNRYRAFLDAYVAEYGDGGQLDPAQIARREDVSMEEAERRAAERQAAQAPAVPPPAPQLQKAGFSGWWILLFLGLGTGAWYMWDQEQKKGGHKKLPRQTQRATAHALHGLPPVGGCGCGG